MYDFEGIEAAFDSSDDDFVREANDVLLRLDNVKAKSADKRLDTLNDTGCSLAQNFCAETFILPFARKLGKKSTAIRQDNA